MFDDRVELTGPAIHVSDTLLRMLVPRKPLSLMEIAALT